MSSSSRSVTACRMTATPSISSNMPLSAMIPSARSLSCLGGAKARLGIARERLLEWGFPETTIGGDERLVWRLAPLKVRLDEALDGVRHLFGDEPVPQDVAD